MTAPSRTRPAPVPRTVPVAVVAGLVALLWGIGAGCGRHEEPRGDEAAPAPATSAGASAPEGPAAAAAALTAYVGGGVSDGGTIEGVVTYAGALTDEFVAVTRDPGACLAHDASGTSRPAGALLVKDGKVANAVAWLDGVTHGKALPSSTVTIENIGCAFVPRVAIGFVGGKVAASNSDPILHDTSLAYVADGRSIGHLALPGAGSRIERNLRQPGLVAVRCETHEWMQGWLHVMDQPYAEVSDAAGAFRLADVPAGDYTLRAWHERLGELAVPVHVTAGTITRVELAFP